MTDLAVTIPKGATKEIQEVNVSLEDQLSINKFARGALRLNELVEEIKEKEKELRNLEDAADELMLEDEDKLSLFKVGEVFLHLPNNTVQETVEKAKEDAEKELTQLRSSQDDIKKLLADLKIHLYAKFGDSINLEEDTE